MMTLNMYLLIYLHDICESDITYKIIKYYLMLFALCVIMIYRNGCHKRKLLNSELYIHF